MNPAPPVMRILSDIRLRSWGEERLSRRRDFFFNSVPSSGGALIAAGSDLTVARPAPSSDDDESRRGPYGGVASMQAAGTRLQHEHGRAGNAGWPTGSAGADHHGGGA